MYIPGGAGYLPSTVWLDHVPFTVAMDHDGYPDYKYVQIPSNWNGKIKWSDRTYRNAKHHILDGMSYAQVFLVIKCHLWNGIESFRVQVLHLVKLLTEAECLWWHRHQSSMLGDLWFVSFLALGELNLGSIVSNCHTDDTWKGKFLGTQCDKWLRHIHTNSIIWV